jgi:hypothetical protein
MQLNIAMQWSHYVQRLGEDSPRQEAYRSLTDAEKEVERLRLLGVRCVAIYSKPAQVLTMCEGGEA